MIFRQLRNVDNAEVRISMKGKRRNVSEDHGSLQLEKSAICLFIPFDLTFNYFLFVTIVIYFDGKREDKKSS